MKKNNKKFIIFFIITLISLMLYLLLMYITNNLKEQINNKEQSLMTQISLMNQFVSLEGIAHNSWASVQLLKSMTLKDSTGYKRIEEDYHRRSIDHLSILYNITTGKFPNEIFIAKWDKLEDEKLKLVNQFEVNGIYVKLLNEKKELEKDEGVYFLLSLVFQFISTLLFTISGFLYGKKDY